MCVDCAALWGIVGHCGHRADHMASSWWLFLLNTTPGTRCGDHKWLSLWLPSINGILMGFNGILMGFYSDSMGY